MATIEGNPNENQEFADNNERSQEEIIGLYRSIGQVIHHKKDELNHVIKAINGSIEEIETMPQPKSEDELTYYRNRRNRCIAELDTMLDRQCRLYRKMSPQSREVVEDERAS